MAEMEDDTVYSVERWGELDSRPAAWFSLSIGEAVTADLVVGAGALWLPT